MISVLFACLFALAVSTRPIRLRSRTIDPTQTPTRRSLLSETEESSLLIIQFQTGLTEPEKISECESLGLVGRSGTLSDVLREVLDKDSYLVRKLPASRRSSPRQESESKVLSWVGSYLPSDRTELSFTVLDAKRRKFKESRTLPEGDADDTPIDTLFAHPLRLVVTFYESVEDSKTRSDLLSEWETLFPSFVFHFDSGRVVQIDLPANDDIEWHPILDYFQKMEQTLWIKPSVGHHLRNYVGNSLIQSGEPNTAVGAMPVWDAGITGVGQVVQVVDTGVDWKNCFFGDGAIDVDVGVPLSHRKFSFYDVVTDVCSPSCSCGVPANKEGDDHDRTTGHGTHVAGSCCGKTPPAISDPDIVKYNGVAKDAKIDFMDVENDGCDALLIPDDSALMMEQIFQPAYDRGVRISTNSWGCTLYPSYNCFYDCDCYIDSGSQWVPVSNSECRRTFGRRCCELCNYYDTDEIALDQFMYDNDDSLIIFAAGNDGNTAQGSTIGAPATARNVLSVGASMTSQAGFDIGAELADIEQSLSYAQDYTDGRCCTSEVQCCGDSDDTVRKICCTQDRKQYFADHPDLFNEDGVADFSSVGNVLRDDRVKPDVVAPGHYVVSAHARGTPWSTSNPEYCTAEVPDGNNDAARLSFSGTSMAAPLVAGSVALIRDYFMQGFGGSGVDAGNPSGALLKATVIHGTRTLTGNRLVDGYITPLDTSIHSPEQGYGLPVLTDVLRHDAYSPGDLTVRFYDRWTIAADEYKHYCFVSGSGAEIRATIAWMDRPPSVASSSPLTNDVDLYICGATSENCWAGNGGTKLDRIHTTEHVRVPAGAIAADEQFQIVLRGEEVGAGSQAQFAFIYSGRGIAFLGTNCTLNDRPDFGGGLSTLTIVGIVVGSIVGVLILLGVCGGCAFLLCKVFM